MGYITSATEYSAASKHTSTMTIIPNGGDVILKAEVDGSFVNIGTVANGSSEILEYGLLGVRVEVTPVSGAQVTIL